MRTSFAWSVLLALGALSVGCAAKRIDLSETGAVKAEKVPSKLVQIPWVVVTQEEGGIAVSGVVRRWPSSRAVIAGHVDVTVLDESGQVLARLSTPYTPSWIPQQGARSSSFRAKIDQPVRPGLVVRVAHDNRGQASCPTVDARPQPKL
jgi:hypothetical protein